MPRTDTTLATEPIDLAGLPDRYMNPGELEALVALVRSIEAGVVIEFGCNAGRTAAAILRNAPSVYRYVGVDVEPGYRPALAAQRWEVPAADQVGRFALDNPRFELMLRPRGTFDVLASELPLADLVFIDGDHSRPAVLNDFGLARCVTKPGGLIVFHDDNRLPVVEVSETLDELAAEGVEVVHVAGTWLAFVRVAP